MNNLLWGQGGDSSGGVTDMGLGTHEHIPSLVGAVLPAWKRGPRMAQRHFRLEKISREREKSTGDAAITCGGMINRQGVKGGNLVWLIRGRDPPLSPPSLSELLCSLKLTKAWRPAARDIALAPGTSR